MNPFFSIIIPLYNKEAFIEDTLQRIIKQSFSDFEVIVIDDGSSDDSLAKAKTIHDERIHIYTQENQGASVARNEGIAKATGSYIALLDADDFWEYNHLETLKECIDAFPEAGLFCTNYKINYNDAFVQNATFNFEYKDECLLIPDFFSAHIINFIPSSSSTAFTKEDFLALGAYNVDLRTGQDTDLWIRFGLHHDIAFNPKITMCYNHFDSNSLSRSNYNQDRYNLISAYTQQEKNHPSLKRYLDVNRYAIALRCKMGNDVTLYKKLKGEIDYNNLNTKQKVLLQLPTGILKTLKKIQRFLFKREIYVSAFK